MAGAGVIGIAQLMVVLDTTIINIAFSVSCVLCLAGAFITALLWRRTPVSPASDSADRGPGDDGQSDRIPRKPIVLGPKLFGMALAFCAGRGCDDGGNTTPVAIA